ncbi:hypothetical protein F2Q70_00001255 [Brassica cretica]|uniref:Uncharacterized protein n=1 Tax=Brassica cretica TaxID=69181 RepID=A0A8S9IX61_BRACR|nr:hypothetical protein F2Q70_00001255 [Brassica cretica]KAF3563655.1 hypothetical protein DY000_02012252 [Brassica cretica]
MKPKERKGRVQQPASSGTNLLKSRVQNDRSESVKGAAMSKKQYVKKISSKPLTVEKRKTNFFEDAEKWSLQDLLRRSSSYKKDLIRAQSQTDLDDDSPVDCVPDIQGV